MAAGWYLVDIAFTFFFFGSNITSSTSVRHTTIKDLFPCDISLILKLKISDRGREHDNAANCDPVKKMLQTDLNSERDVEVSV